MEVAGYSGLEVVGSGGNAHVYRAVHDDTGATLALKVLRGGGDESVNRRFERERTLMAELETLTNVVPIMESGFTEAGDPFLVMPLYTGGSLQARVDDGPMSWLDAVTITQTLAESLALAHAKRILHLDIKPANVLLDDDGEPWLADFGIAEMMGHTASMSAQMMTPAFTPPERLDGSKPSEHTDLYGLMATLYSLLTGRPPYVNDDMTGPLGVMLAISRDPVPVQHLPVGTPQSVVNLLTRGMAKNPDDRPRSAIELVGLLTDVLDGRPVEPLVLAEGAGEAETPLALSMATTADVSDDTEMTVARSTAMSAVVAGPPGGLAVAEKDDSGKRKGLLVALLSAVLLISAVALGVSALTNGDDPDDVAAGDSSSTTTTVEGLEVEEVGPDGEVVVVAAAAPASEENVDDGVADGGAADDAETQVAGASIERVIEPSLESDDDNDTDDTTATTTSSAERTTTTRASDNRETSSTEAKATTTTLKPTTTTTTSTTTTTTTTEAKTEIEAGFRASGGPVGSEQTVSFENITIGDAVSFLWDFGDESSSTQKAPSHTYARADTYRVTITATAADGTRDSATHSVRVDPNTPANPAPEAGFRASGGPVGSEQTVSFENITIGDAVSFRWEFGDGNTSSQRAPSHTYASPGTYSVTITATAADGTSDSATHSVRVDANTVTTPPFEAGWTASASPSPKQQTLNFRSITIGDATTFSWNFGDGESGTGETVSHTYAEPGTYSVTLTASGPGGSGAATHSVQVDANN